MPVQGIDADRPHVAAKDGARPKQLADISDQLVRAALTFCLDGSNLLRRSIHLEEGLADFQLPTCIGQHLLQQILRRTDAVGIVEGQIEVFLVKLCAHMLAGDRGRDCHAFVRSLGRVEQEPVNHFILNKANQISASHEIPAKIALPVYGLR